MGDDIFDLFTENETLKNQLGSCDDKWLEVSKRKLIKHINDEKRATLIKSRMKKQMNKQRFLASVPYNEIWETEFDNIVSKKDKVQDLYFNQLKLEVHDSFKKS